MTYGDDFEDSRVKRTVYWLGKKIPLVRAMLPKLIGAILFLFALAALSHYFFGDHETSRRLVEKSIGKSPYDPTAYVWYNDVADSAITPAVVTARRSINESQLLVLVANQTDDRMPAKEVDCRDLASLDLETNRYYNTLFYDMEKFLTASTHSQDNCVCAPMLGRSVRVLAFAGKRVGDESKFEHMGEVSGMPERFTYVLNPVDVYAQQYTELDGDFLSSIRVNMFVKREAQHYRYNAPRGEYDVLRRGRLMAQVLDKKCHRVRMTLSDDLAVCASRCIDMMDGVDVRERARMQFARGVMLNKNAFQSIAIANLNRVHDEL